MRNHIPNSEKWRYANLWESVLATIYEDYLDELLASHYDNRLLALAKVMDKDQDSLETIIEASEQDFSCVIIRFRDLTYFDTRPKTGKSLLKKQAKVKRLY